MLPVMLNVTGRVVVVVGAGAVGRRKAATAREAGALIRVIDPNPPGSMEPEVVWVTEEYRETHLVGACLVFACGPPQVNAQVVADATAQGVWVNSATGPAAGDFVLPAVARRGGVTVAVSTLGASPALARRLRDKLEAELEPALVEWVALLEELRPVVLATVADPATRRALLDTLADWPWLARIQCEGVAAVRVAMREEIGRAAGA